MSSVFQLLFCLSYFIFGAALIYIEQWNFKRNGAKAYHIFLIFYFIYIIIPSVVIYGIFSLYPDARTNSFFFDSTYANMTNMSSLVLLLLHLSFIVGLYVIKNTFPKKRWDYVINVEIAENRSVFWIIFGTILIFSFFWSLGNDIYSRYANLILFRNQDADWSIDRNFFNSNAFSLTQTFSWFSTGLFFVALKKNGWGLKSITLLVLCLGFAISQGSRRGFIFPVLIFYFSNFLYTNRLHWIKFLPLLFLFAGWIAIGKELTGAIARTGDPIGFDDLYNSYYSLILRAFSDIGISQVQSLATLQYFDFSYRLGVDHILSFLRRIPFKEFLGIEDIYPPRITRITTSLFVSPFELDIPPGLAGASWLDFPFLGAFVWGGALALQCSFVDRVYAHAKKTPEAVMLTTLIMIIISMPINTGSYDFTASIDIIFLLFILWTIIKIKRIRKFAL